MYNLTKSINYGMRRSMVTWIVVFSMVSIPVLYVVFSDMPFSDLTGSFYFASNIMVDLSIVYIVISMILACKAVGADMADKTLNYELMSGHSRDKVFISRIVAGLLWGLLLVVAFYMAPLLFFSVVNGWELGVDKTDVIIRCVLSILVFLRMCAFNMMLACVLRGMAKGIALGYMLLTFEALAYSILEDVLDIDVKYYLGISNIEKLLALDNYTEKIIDGKKVQVFETALSNEIIIGTIVCSIITSGIYIAVAYIVFKKSDRD